MYLLLSYGADPTKGRFEGRSLLEEYIRVKPENAVTLLNYDIGTNGKEISDSNFLFTYDLRLFLAQSLEGNNPDSELRVISKFMEYRQKNMLNLPTPELFLQLKWQMIKKFYFLNWILYVIYLLSLTTLIYWTSYHKNHSSEISNCTISWIQSHVCAELFCLNTSCTLWGVLYGFTCASTFTILLREGMQMLSRKLGYLKSKENIIC